METTFDLHAVARQALEQMRAAGFEHAQVTASRMLQTEVNIAHDEPSLLRSTESQALALLGIVDQRTASTELADFSPGVVAERIAGLVEDARSAPRDDAHAVSSGQSAQIVQGPQAPDLDVLTGKSAELLAFRARETPSAFVRNAEARHVLRQWHTLTSSGSDLAGRLGYYSFSAMGVGREGDRSSSINYAGGSCHDLAATPVDQLFGLGEMLRELPRQVHARPLGRKFTGDVIFSPQAVGSLLAWLLGQLGDTQLIAGSSLYRESVGQRIASPLLTVRSRFDGPGVAAVTADAFTAPPVTLVDAGTLRALTPSLYGSRKTGLPHVPVAAGWEIQPGDTPRAELVASVREGAIVNRLSMGMPAANGDFSSVIKNSFLVEDGAVGDALTESMIAGNMAQMLQDIVGVSRECIDTGDLRLPWLRVAGLHFS
jgi:PmbA protein